MIAATELLFLLLAEIIGGVVVEILAWGGVHAGIKLSGAQKTVNPYLSFIGFCLFGALLGLLSPLVLPTLLIKNSTLAIANIVVTPLVAGVAMAGIGKLRARKNKLPLRIESFAYGWGFATAFAIVRFALLYR